MMKLENFEKAYETVQKVILQTKLVYSDYYSDLTRIFTTHKNLPKEVFMFIGFL